MSDIKLSVIIPVYNTERFLAKCLESVIYQTYGRKDGAGNLEDIEIIIVDDGSTDKSADIYNKYISLDKRISLIKQKNAGVSVARNRGIAAAAGQYIHFIDSDDYLDLDYYEKMLQAARFANADIASSGFRQIADNSRVNISIKYADLLILNSIEQKAAFLNLREYPSVWRHLFKRSLIQQYNLSFEAGNCCGEDAVFTVSALYFANKSVLVPNCMYNYAVNPNSISFSKDPEKEKRRIRDEKHSWEQIMRFSKEHNFELKSSPQYSLIKCKLFHSATLLHKRIV
jgi:glycosyltransferase involved in cell wall biosynthesis